MSSRTIFFKNCPTERKRGEKNCPTERNRDEKNCPTERNREEKNRLQRGGVWRLYELLSGAKKNCPVQFQIVL